MPAPVNNTLPAIKGDTHLGAVLSVDPGVWSDPGTLSFQWTRNGSNVAGATGRSYALRDVDAGAQIAVVVTATNSSGSASATSAAVTAGSISPQPAAGIAGRAWAANTVYKAGDVVSFGGALYAALADFTSGGAFVASNWAAVGPNVELGYAQITSQFSTTSTSVVDVTGMTVTVTVASRPILVTAWAQVQNLSAGGYASIGLFEDGSQIQNSVAGVGSVNELWPVPLLSRRAPAAGSHTYKVQVASSAAGNTVRVGSGAGPTSPAFIQVIQI